MHLDKLISAVVTFITFLNVDHLMVRAETETRTLSCCGKVYIPLTKGCQNTFRIGDKPHVIVDYEYVQGPFQLQVEVKQCVDFTHFITCDVGESQTIDKVIEYKMTPCSKNSAPGAAAAPQVEDLMVRASPTPRVRNETRPLSCCGKVYIPLTKGCRNTFQIGDKPHVIVDYKPVVKGPFQLQVEVEQCVDFTHFITCDVGESQTSDKVIEYKRTPCSKNSAPGAVAPHGSLFSVLLAMALVMMMIC